MSPRALILTATVLAVGAATQPAEAQADEGKIVFVSDRDANAEIYVMNTDGSEQTRLTNSEFRDISPSWSPDGTRIVYSSGKDVHEIYTINADGSDLVQLTDGLAWNDTPSWSPDGLRIVFESTDTDYTSGIYVMKTDSSGITQLPHTDASSHPSWSPDGHQIVFIQPSDPVWFDDFNNIYVMNTDSSGRMQITDGGPGPYSQPSWSPQGKQIAFTFYNYEDGDDEIFVMNADGSNLTQLTYNSASDQNPSWSPDSRRIVFESDRDGDYEIFVMNADGSNQKQITYNEADDTDPHWSQTLTSIRSGSTTMFSTPIPTPTPLAVARQTPSATPSSAVTPTPSLPSPTTVPEPTPERGFFFNSLPSQGNSGQWDFMDPVALSIIGICLTLVGTLIQLFRGR